MNKILYNGQVIIDLDELADKYTKAEVDALVSSVFKYKGTVATKADLNNIVDMNIGDCYNVEADGVNYAWNGEEWSALSGTVDLTNYYTKEQVDGKFSSYLPKNNTTEYTPVDDYNPATKKYVDDKIATDYETIKMTSSLIGPNISSAERIITFELNEVDRANIMSFINKYWNGSILSKGLALQFGTVLMVLNVSSTTSTSITFISNGVVTKDKPIYYIEFRATFTGSTPGNYTEYYESYHPYWKGYAYWASYLHKENALEYTPTANYHPATKKYVDDTASSLSKSISEIDVDGDTIYLPFENGFKFWSESTEILSDDFNAAVTNYINSFKHYTTDIRVKTDDVSGFFGVPVDIQFYNAGGLMTTKDGYVIIKDGDDTYAAMGNKTILQTTDKKYYLASRVSDGTWDYDVNDAFTGSKEVYLIGNDRYLNAITYVLRLSLSFGEGTDIVCSESYLWKYKNGLAENFMLYGDNLNLTTIEDTCQDILDRYLTNPSVDHYIVNEHIKNFYIKAKNRYVKGLTGYYNTAGVVDPANIVFENTDPTKLNSFALTNDGEFHINYVEDSVTGVYNDTDVTPGYDVDYTKLNKVIQKARPDNIDRPIPIILTRTIGDRTVTYEVQATVGYVTSVSTDGTKSKQLSLTFTVVDDGVVLRFYGSGAIDVNATELYKDLLTENIHCWSDDYNG